LLGGLQLLTPTPSDDRTHPLVKITRRAYSTEMLPVNTRALARQHEHRVITESPTYVVFKPEKFQAPINSIYLTIRDKCLLHVGGRVNTAIQQNYGGKKF
jgi:hypothetical protein